MSNATPFLVIGTLAGLTLALGAALLEKGADSSPSGVAARVNEAAISSDEYERAVEALAGDKRNPITDAVRSDVLERLIEEELLVQRGVDVGLVTSDRAVRKSIVNAMIDYVVADRSGHAPTDEEINAFFDANKDYFAQTERLHVQRLFVKDVPGRDLDARVQEITDRLTGGETFGAVTQELSDAILPELPDTLLPPRKLRDYLGPSLVQAALQLEPGMISQPINVAGGYHFLHVVAVQKGQVLALNQVRPQVVAEYNRRSDDEALRDYLNWLKSEAEIERLVTGDAP